MLEIGPELRHAGQGVANRLGQLGLAGDPQQLRLQPALQVIDDQPGVRLPEPHPLVRRSAAPLLLDGERAFALNPVAPLYYYGIHARSLYGAGQHEAAVKLTETCVDQRSYNRVCRAVRIAALGELGRTEQAAAEVRDLLAHAPTFTLPNASSAVGYSGDPETNKRFISRLREAGLPDG